MAVHNELGRWGEAVAADYIENLGYTIVERDWHYGHRDIDIIAIDEPFLVFVEVKTRSNRDFSDPIEAVDYRKLRNLRAAVNHYLGQSSSMREVRFDVISVVGRLGQQPDITHIKDVRLI